MEFCNITRNFAYAGIQFYFSFYDADNQSCGELNIYADTDDGKDWLKDDDNYEEIHQYVKDNFVNKRVKL
jgi:hypothetical protein